VKAIRQTRLGGPEVLEYVDVERPEPQPTEVLVRVRAAGVNPVDWKTRARGAFLGEPPFTVGWDVAGTVEEVGRGVTRFAPGDRVFGMPRFPKEAAAYAEYATSPSRQLARTPDALSDVEAGALPLAALTAWQALVETAAVGRGERVVILGAAGGVGHLAVQIAKSRDAYVIGTASASKHAFLAALGADEVVDYTTCSTSSAATEPLQPSARSGTTASRSSSRRRRTSTTCAREPATVCGSPGCSSSRIARGSRRSPTWRRSAA
jgi:NADPH:quinone reductase-like Zn-dependent oxidoreductase